MQEGKFSGTPATNKTALSGGNDIPPDEAALLWKNKTAFLILAVPAPMNISHKAVKKQTRTSPGTQVTTSTAKLHGYITIILSGVSRNSQHPRNPQVSQYGKPELKFPDLDKTLV